MALPEGVLTADAMHTQDACDVVCGFQWRGTGKSSFWPTLTVSFYLSGDGLSTSAVNARIARWSGIAGNALVLVGGAGLLNSTYTAGASVSTTPIAIDTSGGVDAWHTVRLVFRGEGGDIAASPVVAQTRTFSVWLDGTEYTGLVGGNNFVPVPVPEAKVNVIWGAAESDWQTAWGTSAYAVGSYQTLSALSEFDLIRNLYCCINGVVRYYDPCTDEHFGWSRAQGVNTGYKQAFWTPSLGEQNTAEETSEGLRLQCTDRGLYAYHNAIPDYSGNTRVEILLPRGNGGVGSSLASSYGKGAHRMRHCLSGAEMRGWLPATRAGYQFPTTGSPNLPLFWPCYNRVPITHSGTAGLWLWEVSSSTTYPRDMGDWVEPEQTALGAVQLARYRLGNPTMLTFQADWGSGAIPRDRADWNAPPAAYSDPVSIYNPLNLGSPSAYSAYDGKHFYRAQDVWGLSGDGSGYQRLVGQGGDGVPVAVGYEAKSGPVAFTNRYNPILLRSSDNDTADVRAALIASEDAIGAIDPVTDELVLVAIQDAWASNAEGDYVVNLVTQRLGYLSGTGIDVGTSGVIAELGAEGIDDGFMLADAVIERTGRLWVAVWLVSSAGNGDPFATFELLIYSAESVDASAVLVDTVTVTRPPNNDARFVHDRIADEMFIAYQDVSDAQGVTVHRLPLLDGESVETSSFVVADGDLPTPPYGEMWQSGHARPWELLGLWIDEAGRWRARWRWGEWFNPYTTFNSTIRATAEDLSGGRYDAWPALLTDVNLYPSAYPGKPDYTLVTLWEGLEGAPGSFVPNESTGSPLLNIVYMEDLSDREADLHPLTGAATWSERDLAELLQGAPA